MRKQLTKLTTLALVAAQVTFTTPVFAQSEAALEAARRVNIAGRQRMLSQRISKAVCFISNGQDVAVQRQVLQDAYTLFGVSHLALISGDSSIGLRAETNDKILDTLDMVSSEWEPFSGLVEKTLEQGDLALQQVAKIDETGLQLLGGANHAVNNIANVYGAALPDMPLLLSITIDLAGRQRMFTQKAAKEFCLIDSGIDVAQNRENLTKTAQLFFLTLGALLNGMQGVVMAAPNEDIRQQLEAVAAAWQVPKAALDQAALGVPITDDMRAIIVNDLEIVLTLMNEAVGMYEEAIPEPE